MPYLNGNASKENPALEPIAICGMGECPNNTWKLFEYLTFVPSLSAPGQS